MIFPFLSGLLSPFVAPVTYLLFALNLLVFLGTFQDYEVADQKLEEMISDTRFMEVQGSAFAAMVQKEPYRYSHTTRALVSKAMRGDRDSKFLLGGLALRNGHFMATAKSYDFQGDEIAVQNWRSRFEELKRIQAEHPSYLWGVSLSNSDWLRFVSYQFAHGGFSHLVFNMVFLLVFGAFVEVQLGASFVILTYLGAGVVGALTYSALSGLSSSPLVGASASVSGLIALVGFYWLRREKLKFFYWLLPFEGYFGFARLSSGFVLFILLLPDLSGYLSAVREFGSIAYGAHLGGAMLGAMIALLLTLGIFKIEVETKTGSGSTTSPKQDRSAS